MIEPKGDRIYFYRLIAKAVVYALVAGLVALWGVSENGIMAWLGLLENEAAIRVFLTLTGWFPAIFLLWTEFRRIETD